MDKYVLGTTLNTIHKAVQLATGGNKDTLSEEELERIEEFLKVQKLFILGSTMIKLCLIINAT